MMLILLDEKTKEQVAIYGQGISVEIQMNGKKYTLVKSVWLRGYVSRKLTEEDCFSCAYEKKHRILGDVLVVERPNWTSTWYKTVYYYKEIK